MVFKKKTQPSTPLTGTYEQDLVEFSDKKKPTAVSRKSRSPDADDSVTDRLVNALEKVTKKTYASLEDLDAMPLKTYDDYLKYNEALRGRRRVLRKKDTPPFYLYAPMDVIECVKVKITRTSNRGLPININMRKLGKAIWFKSPKKGFKDGSDIMMPKCLVDTINNLAIPKYKQVKYPDGSHETVLDYMENQYSCQVLMGE